MLISHKWITELLGFETLAEEMATRLTMSGLELEGIKYLSKNFDKIIVGRIVSKKPHPKADNLSVVEATDGTSILQVICGASNCPGEGGLVILALPGAKVGEITIELRELRGVSSMGMICSEKELDIGPDGDGILILNGITDAMPGTPISIALDLEDAVLDISVTPNRPDALSHMGVAREVALLYDRPFEPKQSTRAPELGPAIEQLACIEILDPIGCPRYGASVILGARVGNSPFSISYRLHNLGVRPISNIVDMTNLIALKYGQPLHAFDLDELSDSKIVVRKAAEGEKIITLDEVERSLTKDDLLICDGQRPVAIAGVMGGLNTGVSSKTENILIECACFEPIGIRRTSKRLKLSSEASYRFERGVDPLMGPRVLDAAASLTIALSGGKIAKGLIDCYPKKIEKKSVNFRLPRFGALMGYSAEPKRVRWILNGLGAEVTENGEQLVVDIPTNRPDIEREVDLIEEVARVQGLDQIPSALPRILSRAPDRSEFEMEKKAKELLAGLGLQETVNYSFVPEQMLADFDSSKYIVKIANPLNAERAAMRTTLVPSLLESLVRAKSRFLPGIRQFEVGRTFKKSAEELPKESTMAAAILAGPALQWIGDKDRPLDFFDAKGIVEIFVRKYSGRTPIFVPSNEITGMHPKQACLVDVGSKRAGYLGELHPETLKKYKQPVGACIFELDLNVLWSLKTLSEAVALSEFPPMERDLAMQVDEELDSAPISDALKVECGPLAIEVSLFDIYRGEGIPGGKKSFAFRVIYRSLDHTLTDEEVDSAHEKAVCSVLSKFNAIRR